MSVNSCINCAHAVWVRTKNGRLHPNQEGRCDWKMPQIDIPMAFYYISNEREVPKPSGGSIGRLGPYTNCPCWEPKSGGERP